MPKGLLDKLTCEEVLDLLAYIISRGDAAEPGLPGRGRRAAARNGHDRERRKMPNGTPGACSHPDGPVLPSAGPFRFSQSRNYPLRSHPGPARLLGLSGQVKRGLPKPSVPIRTGPRVIRRDPYDATTCRPR